MEVVAHHIALLTSIYASSGGSIAKRVRFKLCRLRYEEHDGALQRRMPLSNGTEVRDPSCFTGSATLDVPRAFTQTGLAAASCCTPLRMVTEWNEWCAPAGARALFRRYWHA